MERPALAPAFSLVRAGRDKFQRVMTIGAALFAQS
jgi:hypothetical protein